MSLVTIIISSSNSSSSISISISSSSSSSSSSRAGKYKLVQGPGVKQRALANKNKYPFTIALKTSF